MITTHFSIMFLLWDGALPNTTLHAVQVQKGSCEYLLVQADIVSLSQTSGFYNCYFLDNFPPWFK